MLDIKSQRLRDKLQKLLNYQYLLEAAASGTIPSKKLVTQEILNKRTPNQIKLATELHAALSKVMNPNMLPTDLYDLIRLVLEGQGPQSQGIIPAIVWVIAAVTGGVWLSIDSALNASLKEREYDLIESGLLVKTDWNKWFTVALALGGAYWFLTRTKTGKRAYRQIVS